MKASSSPKPKGAALLAAGSILLLSSARAYVPTAYVDIRRTRSDVGGATFEYLYRIEATESNFAPQPPKGQRSYNTHPLGQSSQLPHQYPSYPIVQPPPSDPLLCDEAEGVSDYLNPVGTVDVGDIGYLYKKYVIVPRGGCSFEAKARSAQRLGAAGIMIYNTLHSRYEAIDPNKEYAPPNPDWGNIRWPEDRIDYDCGGNSARDGAGLRFEISSANAFFWSPPPISEASDNFMTGWVDDGNLCAKDFESRGGTFDEFRRKCPSERCLLTGRNATEDGSVVEACCAWDVPVAMASDGDDGDAVPDAEEEPIVIPAYFISMDDGDKLKTAIDDSADSANMAELGDISYISAVPYARWYPNFHYSTVVLWAMAVLTVWISCYESAAEYRRSWKNISLALNEGLVVFSRSGVAPSPNLASVVGGTRERADTDETVDSNDDVEIELPGVDGNDAEETNTPAANRDNTGDMNTTSDIAHDSNFMIDDDFVVNGEGEANGALASSATPPDNAFSNDDAAANSGGGSEAQAGANAEGAAGASTRGQQGQQQTVNAASLLQSRPPTAAERRVELHSAHAVVFILCASAILLLLFFFDLFIIVTIIYGLGGAACMSQIIFQPLYARVLKGKNLEKQVKLLSYFGYWRMIDVICALSAYSMGFIWIVMAFTHVQPLSNTYYWVVQDIMGICYCIYVMGIIHINTIMVGTILLVLVFFYDIFYVFLSPYIFGSSVMVDVAMGGQSGDALFCYKYPSDSMCVGSQAPLPMMLVFPWLLDYRNGFSMIGLGDIVLPGLLISFCARYDGAKFLTRKCSEASTGGVSNGNVDGASESEMEYTPTLNRKQVFMSNTKTFLKSLKKGYFGPMMVAYAVGLSAAYIAVYAMTRGQPALLYIVPACLLTVFALGLRKRQLSDLWAGPKVMRKANRLVALADKIPDLRAAQARAPVNNMPATSVV